MSCHNSSPGEAHGDPAPRVLNGDWSCGHLCPARTVPDSRKTAGAQRTCLCKQCKPREPLYQGTVETSLKFKFPDARQRPTLQSGLSKDSSLHLAELNSLHRSLKWETQRKWVWIMKNNYIRSSENKAHCVFERLLGAGHHTEHFLRRSKSP